MSETLFPDEAVHSSQNPSPLEMWERMKLKILLAATALYVAPPTSLAMPEELRLGTYARQMMPSNLANSLEALLDIGVKHGHTLPGLRRLLGSVQFTAVQDAFNQRFAVFSAHDNRIVINKTLAKQLPDQQLYVMAHEIGHAFTYAKLTPQEVIQWSENFGPWNPSGLRANSFEDTELLAAHPQASASPRTISQLKNTPSRYALSNRHEWIAECFASWMLNQGQLTQLSKSQQVVLLSSRQQAISGPLQIDLADAFSKKLRK